MKDYLHRLLLQLFRSCSKYRHISSSIDIVKGKEYNYYYDDGKLNRGSTQNVFYGYEGDNLVSYTGVPDYSFEYDDAGNPTRYKNFNLTWEKGRQLEKYGKHHFEYNANGIRTSRTLADGTVYNYELEGSKIVKVTYGENVIIPLYDSNDSPIGIICNGTPYWYVKNLQGDVVAIRDESNYDVVRYVYTVWGIVTIQRDHSGFDLATINPFLYRGYIYDHDTKLYYLQSRYYDPEIGRFINPDEPEYVMNKYGSTEHNLFVYCNNNPINYCDPFGNIALTTCIIIGLVSGLIFGGTVGACISYAKYEKVKWKYILIGAGIGAVVGAIAGYAVGIAVGASSTTIFTAKSFAKSFKITEKISKQMVRRGWSESLFKETILNNVGRKAINKATGNAATAYFTSTGAYIVIDNITKEIVQVSNRLDPNWVVDVTIKLLKSDVFVR